MMTYGQGDYTAREMVDAFRSAFPAIKRAVARYYPPLLARITKRDDFLIL